MSDTDINKQDDTSILRAEDIVPPFNNEKYLEKDLRTAAVDHGKDTSSQNEQNQSQRNMSPSNIKNQAQQIEAGAAESPDVTQKANEIPKFDLAEQIMAEQRKITAIKRKAPCKKPQAPGPQSEILSSGCAIKQPLQLLSVKDPVIEEIVARDIENLYRGESAKLRDW